MEFSEFFFKSFLNAFTYFFSRIQRYRAYLIYFSSKDKIKFFQQKDKIKKEYAIVHNLFIKFRFFVHWPRVLSSLIFHSGLFASLGRNEEFEFVITTDTSFIQDVLLLWFAKGILAACQERKNLSILKIFLQVITKQNISPAPNISAM